MFQLRMVQGLVRGSGRNPVLIYGAAVHEGLAAWYRTGSLQSALDAITVYYVANPLGAHEDDWRTEAAAKAVMSSYVREYPVEPFNFVRSPEGEPIIEQPFAFDTGLKTTNGRAIIYGGIFDGMIEQFGNTLVLEHKTTSTAPTSFYFAQFHPNNQISGYSWAASRIRGKRVQGALVNALSQNYKGKTEFKRIITTRTEEDEDEWLKSLQAQASAIEAHYETGHWPMHTSACTMFGRVCDFHGLHQLGRAVDRERVLNDGSYSVSHWDFERIER